MLVAADESGRSLILLCRSQVRHLVVRRVVLFTVHFQPARQSPKEPGLSAIHETSFLGIFYGGAALTPPLAWSVSGLLLLLFNEVRYLRKGHPFVVHGSVPDLIAWAQSRYLRCVGIQQGGR